MAVEGDALDERPGAHAGSQSESLGGAARQSRADGGAADGEGHVDDGAGAVFPAAGGDAQGNRAPPQLRMESNRTIPRLPKAKTGIHAARTGEKPPERPMVRKTKSNA